MPFWLPGFVSGYSIAGSLNIAQEKVEINSGERAEINSGQCTGSGF
jgi:hypothetical protein